MQRGLSEKPDRKSGVKSFGMFAIGHVGRTSDNQSALFDRVKLADLIDRVKLADLIADLHDEIEMNLEAFDDIFKDPECAEQDLEWMIDEEDAESYIISLIEEAARLQEIYEVFDETGLAANLRKLVIQAADIEEEGNLLYAEFQALRAERSRLSDCIVSIVVEQRYLEDQWDDLNAEYKALLKGEDAVPSQDVDDSNSHYTRGGYYYR